MIINPTLIETFKDDLALNNIEAAAIYVEAGIRWVSIRYYTMEGYHDITNLNGDVICYSSIDDAFLQLLRWGWNCQDRQVKIEYEPDPIPY